MTAAVPDPRFRDQLAEQAWGVLVAAADRELVPLHGANSWNVVAHAIVENQLSLIAAEVEARVQAAANQRAAEAVEPGLSVESNGRRLAWFTDDELAAELNRRAALTSPAPAPQGQACTVDPCDCDHPSHNQRVKTAAACRRFNQTLIDGAR